MSELTVLKQDVSTAVSDYLEAAFDLRKTVLQQAPKQLTLVNLVLNRLVDIVTRNGYINSGNKLTLLNPNDLRTILSTMETAFKLQSNIAGLPTSFREVSEANSKKQLNSQGKNSGLDVLPEDLKPLDF